MNVLNRKITVFKEQTRTKKKLFLALICANGIKNNYYAEDMITGVVTLEDLFIMISTLFLHDKKSNNLPIPQHFYKYLPRQTFNFSH